MRDATVENTGEQTEREQFLAGLLDSVDDIVWCTSVDGQRLLYISPAAERVYGRPLDDFHHNKQLWIEAIHPDDRASVETNIRNLLDSGSVEHVYRIVRPDGDQRWLRDRVSVVYDDSGNPVRVGGIARDITDRKRAEQAHRDSEALYQSLVACLPLNLLRKDRQGRRVFANDRYCKLHQKTWQELEGKVDAELFPPHLATKFEADDRRVLESGEVLHDVEQYQVPSGRRLFVERVKAPVRDADGNIVGIQVLLWDVSDKQRAEADLRLERHLLHTLLNNVPDSIYFKDRESRFIRISKSLAERFGLDDPADAIGKSDADFFAEEHARQALADEQQIIETGRAVLSLVEKETWTDGPDTWCSTTKMPTRDKAGNIIGTYGISRDITELMRIEAELARERDQLRALMDHLPDLIFVKDAEGRFITVNAALMNILGVERVEDMVGKTDFDYSPPDLAAHYAEDDQQVILSGRALIDREEGSVDHDGNKRWLLTTKVPVRNAEGKVIGLVGIGRNITKLKQAQAQLREAKEAAEAASRAKSDFLANMSHEIRTPMNAIIGMTELVLDTDLTDAQRDYLRLVLDSGDSLLTLLNDILDFSKIEAGKLELEDAVFDLHDCLGDTMKSLALRAHGKGLELALRVPSDVPKFLHGDISRLRQVVVNLVGNAIKFTHHGEVVVDITCASTSDDQAVLRFEVKDTGIGIPEDKLGSIFGKFIQADALTTRAYGGTGLGLAISSRLVELMGGKMSVESVVGEGSTFTFTAQFTVAQDDEVDARRIKPVVIGGTPVLLVDDNSTNRKILEDMARNLGMIPTVATDAHQAIAAMREVLALGKPFRLLLSDVNMPGVDGFTLAQWIRDDPGLAETVIILLTSSGRPGDAARRQALGIEAHLLKPVKQSELFDAVVTSLGVTAAEDEDDETASLDNDLPKLAPLNVLLAEDNAVNQKLAIGVLQKQGHHVVVANNGAEAVAAWESRAFDLVLMDVQMPAMDGLEATRTIRQREQQTGAHVPIIAMTARAMKGDRERCLEAGMDEYVSKPIRVRQLVETFSAVMSAREQPAPAPETQTVTKPGPETKTVTASEPPASFSSQPLIDRAAALVNAADDEELLHDIAEAFLEEAPRFMREIRQAVTDHDAVALQTAAHALKGSMRAIAAAEPEDRAFVLEVMGANANLDKADGALATLEEVMPQLLHEAKQL